MKSPNQPDWPQILRPGSRIFLGGGAACPLGLVEQMLQHVNSYNDLEIIQSLILGPAPWMEKQFSKHLKINAFYLDPRLSELVNAGLDDYTPAHYSDIPGLFAERIIPVDTVLISVTPPDQWGYCSLGTTVSLTPSAIDAARTVIAQINPLLPRTFGDSQIHISRIHYAIELAQSLPELPAPEVSDVHRKIGQYVAQLINDGDTLQVGVGAIGTAVLQSLNMHQHLGLHTETLGDGAIDLIESGVIDNSRKTQNRGKSISATALGSARLYAFIHQNPHLDFKPTEFVNNPVQIARNDHMVCVNSALEVDLTGQVVMDSISGLFRSGIGSQVDFLRGASLSRGGRPIIAIPSTGFETDGKRVSRIVAALSENAGIGSSRADVHYIVTEFGIATLRGRTIQERVSELIQIAHPDFREKLEKSARSHNLLATYFQLPPPMADAMEGIQIRKVRLKDGQHYILRPLNPADDRRLQEFFYSHTEETINRRYGFTVTRMSRERAFELVSVDQNRDLALALFEMQGPRQVIHGVGRYYIDRSGKSAEIAFVTSELKRRTGIARILLERMLEIAGKRRLEFLWAQVDRDNTPMLRLFEAYEAKELPGEDFNSCRIEIHLKNIKFKLSPEASGRTQSKGHFGLRKQSQ